MEIQILDQTENGLRATCGNKTAFVHLTSFGHVWVTCENAMHQAYRRAGKSFSCFQKAIDGYKSPEMKAIICFAQQMTATV